MNAPMVSEGRPRVGVKKPALLDVKRIRAEFPILAERIYDNPLVYLDNAATTQKPRAVLDALIHYYTTTNANVHRGVHTLSERATHDYEAARATVQRFLGAKEAREILFVRGITEGINLVAQTFGRRALQEGDEILISTMEHHSNIVPWQMICDEKRARLKIIPITDQGELRLDEFDQLLGPRTRLVSLVHVSNTLGTINPVEEVIVRAHRRGVPVLLDGAQSAPHMPVNVSKLDCDFFTFSGHKIYGPTGIGVLYGKAALLDAMPPYQGGGDMISSVTFAKTTYNVLPYKFEAGTPDISGAIGLAVALEYVQSLGWDAVMAHEHDLLEYATAALAEIPGLRIIGTAPARAGVVSFVLDGIHPHDIGTILDREGVAVRTGHHCTQPLMDRFGVPATARASFAVYNTRDDIDALVRGLHKVQEMFA